MNEKKTIRGLLLLAVLVAGIVQVHAADAPGSRLDGQIQLVPVKAGEPIKDFSQVVVWLAPLDAKPVLPPAEHYRMVQRDKSFDPNLLVVPVGSTVDFPNLDPWFHNVFSLFRGKRFDLGLYQAGSQRSVKFDRAGVSYLFCNIHPEMTALVVVVDSLWFANTDKSGHYSIAGVPPGRYQLHVFHKAADQEVLHKLQRTVDITAQDRTLAPIALSVQKVDVKGHKNKYGHDYDPDTLKPEY